MKQETDTLYRGVDKSGEQNEYVLWLTTDKEYARNYTRTNLIERYDVPLDVLDALADEKTTMKYLIDKDWDDCPLFEAGIFDIEAMVRDGYSGYYYYDDEYKCLNVCIFKKSQMFSNWKV